MVETEVLYNGACPICSREVAGYQRMSEAAKLPLRYDDLNDPGTLDRWGIAPDDAAKRLHVRHEGRILSGIDAFVVLWRSFPRLKWLSRVVSAPGIHWGAVKLYDHVLAPLLYAQHKQRRR